MSKMTFCVTPSVFWGSSSWAEEEEEAARCPLRQPACGPLEPPGGGWAAAGRSQGVWIVESVAGPGAAWSDSVGVRCGRQAAAAGGSADDGGDGDQLVDDDGDQRVDDDDDQRVDDIDDDQHWPTANEARPPLLVVCASSSGSECNKR